MNLLSKRKLARAGHTGSYRSDHVAFSRSHKLLVGLRVQDIVRQFMPVRSARMNSGRWCNTKTCGRMEAF